MKFTMLFSSNSIWFPKNRHVWWHPWGFFVLFFESRWDLRIFYRWTPRGTAFPPAQKPSFWCCWYGQSVACQFVAQTKFRCRPENDNADDVLFITTFIHQTSTEKNQRKTTHFWKITEIANIKRSAKRQVINDELSWKFTVSSNVWMNRDLPAESLTGRTCGHGDVWNLRVMGLVLWSDERVAVFLNWSKWGLRQTIEYIFSDWLHYIMLL